MFLALFKPSLRMACSSSVLLLPFFVTITLANSQWSDPRLKEVVERIRAGKYAEAQEMIEPLIARQPSSESYSLLGYVCELQEKIASLGEAQTAYKLPIRSPWS